MRPIKLCYTLLSAGFHGYYAPCSTIMHPSIEHSFQQLETLLHGSYTRGKACSVCTGLQLPLVYLSCPDYYPPNTRKERDSEATYNVAGIPRQICDT